PLTEPYLAARLVPQAVVTPDHGDGQGHQRLLVAVMRLCSPDDQDAACRPATARARPVRVDARQGPARPARVPGRRAGLLRRAPGPGARVLGGAARRADRAGAARGRVGALGAGRAPLLHPDPARAELPAILPD